MIINKYKLNFISYLIINIWIALPFYRVRVGVAGLLLTFIIWIATSDLKWVSSKWSRDMYCVVFFFITFIPYYFTGNLFYGEVGKNAILVSFPIFLIGIFINHYYMYYKKDYFLLGKVALITLITFTIGAIQTLFVLNINPLASRILATGSDFYQYERSVFSNMGAGGFGFIYSVVFLIIPLFYFLTKIGFNYKEKKNIVLIITFIILLLLIIKASYAISLILTFIGILFVKYVKNINYLIIYSVIFLLLFLIFPSDFFSNILGSFANLFAGNDVIYEKLSDFAMAFTQQGGEQTSGRIDRYLLSFNTFLKQPLFGIYGPFGDTSIGIGGHSGWLDLLGFYGLFSGLPLFFIFYFNFKKHLNFYKNSTYQGCIVVVYLLFVVFGFINPVLYVYEIGYMVFAIVPVLPMIYLKKEY